MEQTVREVRAGWLARARSWWFLGFLYLPIAVLIVYSFNGEGVGGFPPRDLTLNWYRILFQDGAIWDSVGNSLLVAAFAAGDLRWRSESPRRWRWTARSFPGKRCSGDWCCCR